MKPRPRRVVVAQAGFTLIELLVALALLALISVMLVGTLRFAHTAWARADAATNRLQRTELAMNVARRALQQAYPLSVAGIDRPRAVAFSGSAASVVFLAPPVAALGLGGLQVTWLTIERDGDDARLVLRWRPFDRAGESWPPQTDGGSVTDVVLADHIGGAELAYFGPDPNAPLQSPREWRRDWTDAGQLPNLVRLSGSGGWPDLVTALRLSGSTGLVQLAVTPGANR
jgi:general secretion pathway protein J